MFSSGHFAYAYLGGPFEVLTLDNDGWGQQNFAAVCAHETGHIFYAMDEYYSAGSPCTSASGYLRYENQNSQYGTCLEDVPFCIMRSVPLEYAVLCTSTKGQIAWVDADGDSVADVLDTSPAVQIISVGKNGSSTVQGIATVTPITNLNPMGYGNEISVNTIGAVQYQLDAAGWAAAQPADGAFDGGSENFIFQPAVADSGTYHLQVRAVNSWGTYSAALFEADIEVVGATGIIVSGEQNVPGAVRLLGNRPNPFNPSTEIALYLTEGAGVRAVIYDARGALVRRLFDDLLPMGDATIPWDGADDAGRPVASGRYFYRVEANGSPAVTGAMLLLR